MTTIRVLSVHQKPTVQNLFMLPKIEQHQSNPLIKKNEISAAQLAYTSAHYEEKTEGTALLQHMNIISD